MTCPFGFRATRGIWATGYGCVEMWILSGQGTSERLEVFMFKEGEKELWFMEMVLCRSKWNEFSPF